MLQVIAHNLGVIHLSWCQYGTKINEFVYIEKSHAGGQSIKEVPIE